MAVAVPINWAQVAMFDDPSALAGVSQEAPQPQ